MGEVVQLRSQLTGHAYCMGCGEEWAGVAAVGVVELECGGCGSMKGRWRHGVERGVMAWRCNCGNCGEYVDA